MGIRLKCCVGCHAMCEHDPEINQPSATVISTDPKVPASYTYSTYYWQSGDKDCLWTWIGYDKCQGKFLLTLWYSRDYGQWRAEIRRQWDNSLYYYSDTMCITCKEGKLSGLSPLANTGDGPSAEVTIS